MIYKFPLGIRGATLINPIVVLDSVGTEGVILDLVSNIFYAPCKLILPCGSEINYEFASQTLPTSWDGEGVNAWVADRLAEHAI